VGTDFFSELCFLQEFENLLFFFLLRGRGGKKFFLTYKKLTWIRVKQSFHHHHHHHHWPLLKNIFL
jgi:hypothetical protein